MPKTLIPTSAVSRKRSNCLWPEIEGIVTSLNVTQDLKKLRSFLVHFKDWIAKELLEWTRVSCKKEWLYITNYFTGAIYKHVSPNISFFQNSTNNFLPLDFILVRACLVHRIFFKEFNEIGMGRNERTICILVFRCQKWNGIVGWNGMIIPISVVGNIRNRMVLYKRITLPITYPCNARVHPLVVEQYQMFWGHL